MPKTKRGKDQQWSTQHENWKLNQTIPIKNWCEIKCCGRVSSQLVLSVVSLLNNSLLVLSVVSLLNNSQLVLSVVSLLNNSQLVLPVVSLLNNSQLVLPISRNWGYFPHKYSSYLNSILITWLQFQAWWIVY